MGRKMSVYAVRGDEMLFFESTREASKYFKCAQSHVYNMIKRHHRILGYLLLDEEMANNYIMPKPKENIKVRDLLDDVGYDLVHYTKPNCFVWYGLFSRNNTDPFDPRLNKKVIMVYENKTEAGVRRVIAI